MNVSMFRKTVLATAIIGAGLGSMTGAAFAGDDPGDGGHHHGGHSSNWSDPSSGGGCSNTVGADAKNGSGDSLGDTTGGDQDLSASNLCHILTGNEILSNNNVSTLGSSIVNGDTLTSTLTRTSADTSNTQTTTGVPAT
ncbi:hypothetical protein [Actinomycetospora sp. NBRC 106378]|uniref:hypothetical protein n=1 Tax=Actinomycetospora sp. NBRC 106378 TaxID=3032208 RepID=UPI0024A39024|nr:hypothetical protein [Actinomycetospora sp. NBRC 106378]GLZ50659.1 hypothetical protein Acsp07_02760 [Actinomycetospora sp. NBRC 106378]